MFRRGSGGVQSNCLNHFSICRRFHLFDLFNDVTCETFVKVLETFAFFAALSLLLDLDGLFHRGANLAIWTLNVVSAVGDLSWLFATSSVATSSCQAMTDKATAGALWAFGRASGTDRPTQCQVVATVIRCGLQRPVHPVPRRELAYVTRRAMFNWKARCGVAGFRGCSEEVQGGFSQTV